MSGEYISLQEAGRRFGIGRTTLYLWERKGLLKLKRLPVGRYRVWVKEAALKRLLGRDTAGMRSSLQTKQVLTPDADPFFALSPQRTGIADLADRHNQYAYATKKNTRTTRK